MGIASLNFVDVLSPEERKEMKESAYFVGLVHNPGWIKAMEWAASFENEALNKLKANTDSRDDTELRMRWQQRGYFKDALIQYVQGMADLHQQFREIEKERLENGNPAGNTEFDADLAG